METGRGAAVAATWRFHVENPWRRVAAPPRPRRGDSASRPSARRRYIAVIFDGDEVELTGGRTAMQATAERAAAAEARGDVVAIDV